MRKDIVFDQNFPALGRSFFGGARKCGSARVGDRPLDHNERSELNVFNLTTVLKVREVWNKITKIIIFTRGSRTMLQSIGISEQLQFSQPNQTSLVYILSPKILLSHFSPFRALLKGV